jgi:tRNA A37 threonylcarbamoyladenosine dehydratase
MTADAANTVYARQRDILDPDAAAQASVVVCGVGTVGSNAAMQLAKMGVGKLTIYDMDDVDTHNIPSQDYMMSQVGHPKTSSLAYRLGRVSNHVKVETGGELVGGEWFDADVVILAVDSMDLRKKIYETSVRHRANINNMMDFRMDASNIQWWNVHPTTADDLERYEESLYSDEDVVSSPCGGRTFAPVGALSGSLAAQSVADVLSAKPVPFYSMMDLAAWTLTTTTDHIEGE